MRLSVVIPTLNEAHALPRTLHALRAASAAPVEVIVSDCRSPDGTAAVARACGARLVTGACCRADALNRGAAAARGDVLLFLHADTRLPDGFDRSIAAALARPGIVGGAFDFSFDRSLDTPTTNAANATPTASAASLTRRQRCALRFVELLNGFRYRWGRRFFGDQAIFVRRDAFDAAGGFPPMPLMEDIHFCARLSRLGRTAILAPPIRTSPRRFLARGVLRQLAGDMRLLILDSFGARPRHLWDAYNAQNRA